ncbi:hypothetical protein N0V90_012440 [Kalmusia sp. IMI 367209]|nr:hypothetical protein N0V90_012440 [Kalmusia sp. IMI 367209]
MAEAPFPPSNVFAQLDSRAKQLFLEVAWSTMQSRRVDKGDGSYVPTDAIRVTFTKGNEPEHPEYAAIIGECRAKGRTVEGEALLNFARAHLCFEINGIPKLREALEIKEVEILTDEEYQQYREARNSNGKSYWKSNYCMNERGRRLWYNIAELCIHGYISRIDTNTHGGMVGSPSQNASGLDHPESMYSASSTGIGSRPSYTATPGIGPIATEGFRRKYEWNEDTEESVPTGEEIWVVWRWLLINAWIEIRQEPVI